METDRLIAGSTDAAYGSPGTVERGGPPGSVGPSDPVTGAPWGDDDELYIQQAVVFIEDAIQYRSINHRVDARSLRLYRWYYSRICQWGLNLTIAVVLLLAFIERPSSMSISSDPRLRSPTWEPPCGFTETIEVVCIIIFCLDLTAKSYLIGWEEFKKTKWLIGYMVVLSVTIVDWVLSVSMDCDERLRVRRLLRPFFLLQNSSLMKKTLKCIKRTLPEIASVLLLLAVHLCLFTMIGMLLFAKTKDVQKNSEWRSYFTNMPTSLTSLLVLLTTANNPDVMIPAYSLNRAYCIFFVIFSVIGTYCLMNLLTAIIYNQFRGYLLMSVQTSIIRRRLGIRAAFQVLTRQAAQDTAEVQVGVDMVQEVMNRVQMENYYRTAICMEVQQHGEVGYMDRDQFKKIFDELDKDRVQEHPPLPQYESPLLQKIQKVFSHYYLTVLGNVVALAHVLAVCTVLVLNSEKATVDRDNHIIEIINLCFILYYLVEMCGKIFAFGWRGYLSYRNNIFDGFCTVLLLVLLITIFITYKSPLSQSERLFHSLLSLWEMIRLVNMLIVFRFLRIIPNIKLMALVASTLLDLVKNLRAFAGILVVVYYVFAMVGIWLFEGTIKPQLGSGMENITSNISMACGTYEQLGYWPKNFDDFAAAIVLLYDVMVINNWQVFLDVYTRYTTEWSKIYFVCWWITSSVMWVNLFVALILENFIYKWDRSHSCSVTEVENISYETSVQLIFKAQIQEPTEEELVCHLHKHPHLDLQW
ncbi:two pore channel protein 2 isoform X1 [Antennarius striatus]|uniref:two pore channel protein 2 isoform X1 n=1 Tax=Antennarius striatus TaxID=241820 RepID=UPI0035AF45F8